MSTLPPEARLWELMRGALATRALAIVADLGVADALSSGPRPADEIAADLGADPDTLHRLLRALASEGVFEEEKPGVFCNNASSERLKDQAIASFAHLHGGVWHRVAGELDHTGESPFRRVHGTDFWSWLDANPEERAVFDCAMVEGVDRRVQRLLEVFWRGDETVVDVGGGNGSLLESLLDHMPALHGVVFDLPGATRQVPTDDGRVSFESGDFFRSVPAGDVYVLSTVLHDWDDAHAAEILTTLRRCAPTGARVLILEAVVPLGNEPHSAKWLDLLLFAIAGGRERDESQWRALLADAGFEVVAISDGLIEARCLSR